MMTDKPVRGSRSGRPIMALLDLLGRRWALRIIWELRAGPLTFRELRSSCAEMSPSVLNQRLAELREALLIESGDRGYVLSQHGRELAQLLWPMHQWAENWAEECRQRSRAPNQD